MISGLISSYFGILRGQDTYFQLNNVWSVLAGELQQPFAGLPVSVVSADAGFLTETVQSQCSRRRWWLPTVGRAGAGRPIARAAGRTGLFTMGKDDVCSWWSGRVSAERVHLPMAISRAEIAELCAAEALTAIGGGLKWAPIAGRPNHLWDAATLAIHARHVRPLAKNRRGPRLLRVG